MAEPEPGHQRVAEMIRQAASSRARGGEGVMPTTLTGLQVLTEATLGSKVSQVTAQVSPAVDITPGEDGVYDGFSSFYITFYEGLRKGAYGLRSFIVTVHESDEDDMPQGQAQEAMPVL